MIMAANLKPVDLRVVGSGNEFDKVTLELSCATSLITALQCLYEGGVSMPSNESMMESLHGIKLLIEATQDRLSKWEVAR